MFVSGLVWVAAAWVESSYGVARAFPIFFFAGMFIFPLGALACRFLFRRERESRENPIAQIALESTVAMIGGLFAAWLFLPFNPDYVFPLAAIAVGTHYAVFRTIYGDRLFWLLGALITAVGGLAIYEVFPAPSGEIAAVGFIELLFATLLTARAVREHRSSK